VKKIIIANWKMNPLFQKEAKILFELENKEYENLEIIICAPFVFLQKDMGAQDCHYEKKGAFTGEVSAEMLKNIGVKYVILGHSETKEKDKIVNQKAKACLRAGLMPIICIEKEKQIKNRLKDLKKDFIVAYEPLENKQPMPPDKAWGMSILIRKVLKNLYSRKKAERIKILYGGDINEKNAGDYRLDGLLIGQASLDAQKFLKICNAVNQTS